MTATQAPTPGPLDSESVKLLVKLLDTLKPFAEVAEKLKHCHVVEICEPSPDNPSRNIIPMPREWFERAGDDLEYIAIQLHASGVLSEGQTSKITGLGRVEVRREVDRLAPTAPVEAIGSEREVEILEQAIIDASNGTLPPQGQADSDDPIDGLAHMVIERRKARAALRPQPSGETREDVARELWDYQIAARRKKSLSIPKELGSRILALLSARPLALGGQQGDSETLRVLLDNLVIAQTLSKDIRQKATDEACSYLYDRRTTPARAEAQDEGAAGDSAIALARRCTQTIAAQHGPDSDFANGARMVLAALICAPSAHPSPTPARAEAQAEEAAGEIFRQRLETSIRRAGGLTVLCRTADSRAKLIDLICNEVAALKSTAAKEGGES